MSKIKSIGFSYIDTALDEILNRNYTFIGILNTLSITFEENFQWMVSSASSAPEHGTLTS